MKVNGWKILFFEGFAHRYKSLVNHVLRLRDRDPNGFISHPQTKLLARVQKVIKEDIPQDPLDPKFNIGNTLGPKYRAWRRSKSGMGPRYRLFFKCNSESKEIIIVWLNDEYTLRKEGSKTDLYVVFKKMLDSGEIPNHYCDLLCSSKKPDNKR